MHVREADELLGLPARLAVTATLADGGRWSFSALGEETGLADGNLHVQLGRLVEAGYVARDRERRGNRTVTVFELTGRGRAALEAQLDRLRAAVARDRPQLVARRGELGSAGDGAR